MTELFTLDIIFDLSDYFICVVNGESCVLCCPFLMRAVCDVDFTSLDQRYLDKLTRSLQNSTKVFREVIVVHNLKARCSQVAAC